MYKKSIPLNTPDHAEYLFRVNVSDTSVYAIISFVCVLLQKRQTSQIKNKKKKRDHQITEKTHLLRHQNEIDNESDLTQSKREAVTLTPPRWSKVPYAVKVFVSYGTININTWISERTRSNRAFSTVHNK